MTIALDTKAPLRVLICALGGEGGGVLMNWIIAAARESGREVQATSVPGVAQRTGSTTYYIEIADQEATPVFSLVPMPGRVDVLVASELVEAGRALEAGYVSPELTTLIGSTGRSLTTTEKIDLGDGRYASERIEMAAEALAKVAYLRDFSKMAEDHGTCISAVLFGAMAASGALPWSVEASRTVVDGAASLSGFDAAVHSVDEKKPASVPASKAETGDPAVAVRRLPEALWAVAELGRARCADYQDDGYADLYLKRVGRLVDAADITDPRIAHALDEAARRLALWMAYEDIARVADLKTRPERFEKMRAEAMVAPGQILRVIEYLKPRSEEIADILPVNIGRRLMAWVEAGYSLPGFGKGRLIRSTGPLGFRLLRGAAWMGRFRRGSLRFSVEQAEIETWLCSLVAALGRSPEFAGSLAELPRVRKGYSDTAQRGLRAYRAIIETIVAPALAEGREELVAQHLREAISAAMADEHHGKLDELLGELTELNADRSQAVDVKIN